MSPDTSASGGNTTTGDSVAVKVDAVVDAAASTIFHTGEIAVETFVYDKFGNALGSFVTTSLETDGPRVLAWIEKELNQGVALAVRAVEHGEAAVAAEVSGVVARIEAWVRAHVGAQVAKSTPPTASVK